MPTNDLSPAAEALLVEERQRFEAWIEGPPYERDTSRYSGSDEQTAWPGQYVDLAVQLAWEAWQKAGRAEAAPRWTACAEGLPAEGLPAAGLPAEGVPVLVWLPGRRCCVIAAWHNWPGGLTWRGGAQSRYPPEDVLAWRPLPPGPEEGEKEC